jgi:hypothetical protein
MVVLSKESEQKLEVGSEQQQEEKEMRRKVIIIAINQVF